MKITQDTVVTLRYQVTDAKGARALIYAVPKKDPDTVFVGLNDRDAAWHDVYRVKISTGERTLLRKNTERIAGWVFDLAGQLRLAVRVTDNGDTEVLRIDPEAFTKVYSCTVLESCGPTRFHKDGKRVSWDQFAGKYRLPFVLLSDQDGAVRKAYGVAATLGILPGRVTFVIDRDGAVRHVVVQQLTENEINAMLTRLAP